MEYRGDLGEFFGELSERGGRGEPCFFLVNYELTEAMLFDLPWESDVASTAHSELPPADPLSTPAHPELSFAFPERSYHNTYPDTGKKPELGHLQKHPEPLERYATRFERVMRAMREEGLELINLTLATPITLTQSLEAIYFSTDALYKVLLRGHFVCFSPERFIHISADGVLTSHPMKGTISRLVPNAREVILSDPKEQREHHIMVESMKAELQKVGEQVSVPRYRYITEIENEEGGLLQVSSEVRAELGTAWASRMGDILQKLLPAGSIAGVPKAVACRVIEEAEERERGFYSGISGYFDGTTLETSVLIRFIEEQKDGQKLFHAGGGVTSDSQVKREYEEVLAKIYLPNA